MLRPVDVIMIGLLLGGAAFTFKVKHDSEVALERVAKLEDKIRVEQDAIDILQADWSLLTDPKRLARLVERYNAQLQLQQTESTAIGTISEVPVRPPEIPASPDEGISALLKNADDVITGTVDDGEGN